MKKGFVSVLSGVISLSLLFSGCSAAGSSKELFEMSDNAISHLTDDGMEQKDIVIPAGCSRIDCSFSESAVTTVKFETDDDIDFGVAFVGCEKLKSISLPANLKALNPMAFMNCSSLESIEIPAGVLGLDGAVFCGCTALKEVKIDGNVTVIGDLCFSGCSNLPSIELPDSLQEIGLKAFQECTSLTSIDLPVALTTIEASAFTGCSGLTSISIPSSLKTIGFDTFYGTDITDIYVPADMELTAWELTSFSNEASTEPITIHVVEGSWADAHFDEVFIGGIKSYA